MEKLVYIQRRPIIEVQPSKFYTCDAGCLSGTLWEWALYNEPVNKKEVNVNNDKCIAGNREHK